MNEDQYVRDTTKDMDAIANMLEIAGEHNMQVEVVWSLLCSSEDIPQLCFNALCEWDL